jgi:clan AA aspartic protease (TIGR02281 family)
LVCPNCHIVNPAESKFCYNCGTPLRARPPHKRKWIVFLISLLILGVGGVYLYDRMPRKVSRQRAPEVIPQRGTPMAKDSFSPPYKEPPPPNPQEKPQAPQPGTPLFGEVLLRDITGRELVRMSVGVGGDGWVALPRRDCLGGYDWTLRVGKGTRLKIEGGILADTDEVGLWRIQEDLRIDGLDIHPWNRERPVSWVSMFSPDSPEPLKIEDVTEQGYFVKTPLPEGLQVPGVFIQDDGIVGWTFAGPAKHGFLWRGDEGRDLRPQIRVDDFYRMTFADGREEEFTRALAMTEEYSDLDRLEAFADGFRLDPKLSRKDTPAHLLKEAIIPRMQALLEKAVQQGFVREVADIFDASVLIRAGDIGLLIRVMEATAEGYGVEEAIGLGEYVGDRISPTHDKDMSGLKELRSRLFQEWITASLDKKDLETGWRAFQMASQRLPDDLDIHLLGVELALAENDWAEAQRLLRMKEYPSALRDRVETLRARISELRGRELKIVVRFSPGARRVPVKATLGQGVQQDFMVDTGASMVTIPLSTAEALGIRVDDRNPVRRVYTAGGPRSAPEVTLPSIVVDGWEVKNVKALVLDLPNQAGWGLLGLNYLDKFRMHLSKDEGLLVLEPR